jgi:galactonate dehydratase
MAVPRTEPVEGTQSVRYAESLVRAVREAVGPEVDLMVDLHARTLPPMAIQYCRAFEPYGLLFFEEPCPTEDIEATAQVTRQSRIPIATGERLVGRHQFRELFEKRACHVIQPDLSHCGGLGAARRIAALARAFHIRVFPHVWGTPVAVAAGLHFAATLPSMPTTMTPTPLAQEPLFEFDSTPHPIRDAMSTAALRPKDGWLTVPDGPGLGVEVDVGVVRHFAARRCV